MNPEKFTTEALCNVHSHLREGEVVGPLIKNAYEGGADLLAPMPNTSEGLTTAKKVLDYIGHARSVVPLGKQMTFMPIMMINEETPPRMIDECVEKGIHNAKLYPKWRTTKSHNGIKNYGRLLPLIAHCGKVGMKCHFHPEHPSMDFDNRDAEFAFLPIVDMFLNETQATLIWEHGTDGRCVRHWKTMAKSDRFYVTITPHHLAENEDGAFGDVASVCKPPIKTREDQCSLVRLVAENHLWVMAGPDDAPHDISAKYVSQGCCACGAYHSPYLLALYAHVLDDLLRSPGGRRIFSNFTSRNARKLHGLPPASRVVTMTRSPFQIPVRYAIGPWTVMPFWAGRGIRWQSKN